MYAVLFYIEIIHSMA